MIVPFEFSPEEREAAVAEGRRRQGVNAASGVRGRNGGPERGKKAQQIHLIGAAGEMAVASYLGLKGHLYAETMPVPGSPDLPPCIDVKATIGHRFRLIIQLDGDPDKLYVLVTIENGETVIRGFIPGRMGMKEEYIDDPVGGRPAYFVPQKALYPIELLAFFVEMFRKYGVIE